MSRYARSYEGEKRTANVDFQLTPSERAALETGAAESGASLSQHARELCLRRSGEAQIVAGTRRNPDRARDYERAVGNREQPQSAYAVTATRQRPRRSCRSCRRRRKCSRPRSPRCWRCDSALQSRAGRDGSRALCLGGGQRPRDRQQTAQGTEGRAEPRRMDRRRRISASRSRAARTPTLPAASWNSTRSTRPAAPSDAKRIASTCRLAGGRANSRPASRWKRPRAVPPQGARHGKRQRAFRRAQRRELQPPPHRRLEDQSRHRPRLRPQGQLSEAVEMGGGIRARA